MRAASTVRVGVSVDSRREQHLVLFDRATAEPLRIGASGDGWWWCRVHGTSYHERGARGGDFSPRTSVGLIRELANRFDLNAVAVQGLDADGIAGYLPKSVSARVAPLLDVQVRVAAVSMRGARSGEEGPICLLVAKAELLPVIFAT